MSFDKGKSTAYCKEVMAGEMTKEHVVRDECEWTEDLSSWHPRYFVLRKSQVGGFEIAYFKDQMMAVLAGMILTLDVKEVKIREFPDHPFTLTFETRRGRLFGFAFKDRALMQSVGECLPLPIVGLKTGMNVDPTKELGHCLQKTLSVNLPGVKQASSQPPSRARPTLPPKSNSLEDRPMLQKPSSQGAAISEEFSIDELENLYPDLPTGHKSSMSQCFKAMERRASTMPVIPLKKLQTAQNELGCAPTRSHRSLFHVDDITLELSESEELLTVIGENNEKFQSDVLPYLSATSIKLGIYTTTTKFAQLSEAFIQRSWDLTTCNIFKEGAVRCSFTTRWGEKILRRIKHLDDANSKKELMECLCILKLSLDLSLME